MLRALGYTIVRRKGSHVRLKKTTAAGEHNITIPDHRTLAKGTLSDIVAAVSVQNGVPKQELLNRLRS
jgi:predicted RNA binding protein YcfA (HicA-like mRNA interferase family)